MQITQDAVPTLGCPLCVYHKSRWCRAVSIVCPSSMPAMLHQGKWKSFRGTTMLQDGSSLTRTSVDDEL